MNVTLYIFAGGVIILILAMYAGYLWRQVKKQHDLRQTAQAIAIDKRNANIFNHVDTLCMVGIRQQCDLAEISIRLCCMLEFVQGTSRIDVEQQYPATFELYTTVKNMARGDVRQLLSRQERMKQNRIRYQAESRLASVITTELEQLRNQIQPLMQAPEQTLSVVRQT